MDESGSNGHARWKDDDGVATKAYERLTNTGSRRERYGNGHTNGEGPATRRAMGDKQPPHSEKRHPEDPPGAYRGAAEEICDPEQIRRNAERFGKASQALDPEWFEWLVRPLYRCVHDVRIGAITIPARREIGQQLKQAATTEDAIAEIEQEGIADGEKADRLKAEVIPRVDKELADAEAKEKATEKRVVEAREDVSRVRAEEEERRARLTSEPRESLWRRWVRETGVNLFSRVGFSAGKAGLVFLVEMIGSAYLLAPDVADLMGTTVFPEGLLIAGVISIAMLAAGFAAGMGVAAIRLPGWAVGASIVAAFAAILVKFVPALDALRNAEKAGIETLTAATLAAFLIAMISGYALATKDDQQRARQEEDEEIALLKKAGTPLGEVLDVLAEEKSKHQEAGEERERLEQLREALWTKVEDLRDKASRAGAAIERRRQEGIEAEVEVETIRATADAGIEQEEAAAEWAYLIALAAREKAYVEELPKVPETPASEVRIQAGGSSGREDLSLLQKLALAVAAAGGIASLFLGLTPLGASIPVAALLVLLDRQRRAQGGRAEGGPRPIEQRPRIVAAADAENPLYVHQPDHMVPKYRDGGADAGERQ